MLNVITRTEWCNRISFSIFIEPHKKAWLAFFVVKSAMKIFWQLEKDIHKIRTQCVIHVINDCMLYCIRVSCIIVWRFYSGFFYVKKKISTQQKMNYECKKRIHTTYRIRLFISHTFVRPSLSLFHWKSRMNELHISFWYLYWDLWPAFF